MSSAAGVELDAGKVEGMSIERYRIHGRVQGVGFRWWTRQRADQIGVRGWVKNLPDGTVAVVAEGPSEKLEDFAAELRRGPPGARVEEVQRLDPEEGAGADGGGGAERLSERFQIR